MVKLGKRRKAALLESLKKWHAEASTVANNGYWDVGECDVCEEMVEERLSSLEQWFPNGAVASDPPWLFCEEHARELGVIW
ncbi:hypothetical protein LCGC14_0592820 [marine sediment metagenome]|uniref:Uncharacterized protein n=1 Tax=marine sediment metagenome TaxID=412755 RepID=A0A0F9RHX9_9ZZZZ